VSTKLLSWTKGDKIDKAILDATRQRVCYSSVDVLAVWYKFVNFGAEKGLCLPTW